MSKAEERALEVYPPKLATYSDLFGEETLDDNGLKRAVFIEGYRQAEEDNELTWEDMFTIFHLINEVLDDDFIEGKTKKEVGEEALRRFNEERNKE